MSREFRYRVTVDTEQVRGAARTMQRTFEQELNRVRVQAGGGTTGQAAAGGGLLGGMGGALVGGLAGFASVQGARMLAAEVKQWSEYAATVNYTSEAFNLLSGTSENAAAKLYAVQSASGGAVDSLQAMNIANRAGALGMATTAQELERVTRFATIAGRVLGLDTASALDNMALAASNLSFVRLDQMGISASETRKIFQELRGELGDNKAFLEAMLQVGEATFADLSDSALTVASGIGLMTTRIQEFKIAAAGQGGWLDEDLRNLFFRLGGNETSDLIARLQEQQARNNNPNFWDRLGSRLGPPSDIRFGDEGQWERVADTKDQSAAIDVLAQAMQNLDQAVIDGVPGAQAYQSELWAIARSAIEGAMSNEQIERLQTITEWWQNAAWAASVYNSYASAGPAPAISPKTGVFGDEAFSFMPGQGWTSLGTTMGPEAAPAGYGQIPSGWGAEDWTNMLAEGARERERLDQQLASDQTRIWRSAVDDMAGAFDRAISGIPGLPGKGRSPTTQEQMDRAAAGLPQDFADDFLRRAEDELINGVDRADIDRGFIEQLLGVGGGMPGDVLFGLLSEQYQSGQLFANPFAQSNIDQLINFDAVGQGLQDQQDAQTGMAFVESQLKERFGGMDYAGLGQTLTTGLSDVFAGGQVDFAGQTVGAIQDQFATDTGRTALTGLGVTMAENLFGGFTGENGVASQPWAHAIAASVKADIMAWLEQHMGAQ